MTDKHDERARELWNAVQRANRTFSGPDAIAAALREAYEAGRRDEREKTRPLQELDYTLEPDEVGL